MTRRRWYILAVLVVYGILAFIGWLRGGILRLLVYPVALLVAASPIIIIAVIVYLLMERRRQA